MSKILVGGGADAGADAGAFPFDEPGAFPDDGLAPVIKNLALGKVYQN